jgi:hypothetical protein
MGSGRYYAKSFRKLSYSIYIAFLVVDGILPNRFEIKDALQGI